MARQKMTIIMVWSVFPSLLPIIIGLMIGIDLARLADLPSDVLVEGRRVADRLAALQTSHEESSESRMFAVRRKALLRVISFSVTSFCILAYLKSLGYFILMGTPTWTRFCAFLESDSH
jgi:hypothetical protein